jgi:translocation protein SEC63
VEKENSVLVLGLYALVFMIALPTVVGIWWYRSVKYGGDQVLLDTTQLFYCFIHKTPHMVLKRVLMIVAASLEFEKSHNSEVTERPTDNMEVPQLIKELPLLGEKNKERPLCFGYSIKARALLHAHLSRMKLPPNSLDIDRMFIVKKCPYLIQEFVQCVAQLTMLALAGRIARIPSLETLESAMKMSALIVQALWESKSPLLQLPHMTEELLRHFTTRRRSVRSLLQLAQMKDDDRRSMLRNLSDDQYEDIMNVVGNMPLLELEVRSEVLDDEDSGTITAGAIVTVTVSLTRKPMSSLFDQTNSALTAEEVEDEEQASESNDVAEETGQELAQNRNQSKPWEKNKGKKGKGGKGNKNKKKPAQAQIKRKPQQNPDKSQDKKDQNKDKEKEKEEDKEKEEKRGGGDKKRSRKEGSKERKTVAVPRKSEDESDISESDLSEVETDEESSRARESDLEEIRRETNQNETDDEDDWERVQGRVSKKEKALETKSRMSHSVHCPYFPDDKQEFWWIYLADRKRHALITVPVLMTNLVSQDEVELKFTAPPKPGVYSYSVIVRSDSYVEFDVTKNIKLDVKEAKEIVNHPQWDISEEEDEEAGKDEDSAVEDSDLLESDDEDVSEDSDD